MTQEAVQLSLPGFEQAHGRWRTEYGQQIGADRVIKNRSRIEIKPLYTPRDWNGDALLENLGFPGQYPFTRGIYPTMHRGRTWTQRQLIGLGMCRAGSGRLHRSRRRGSRNCTATG